MKIGCIIRSVGERTENLCIDSVEQYISDVNIIKNVSPFHKAVDQMFEYAAKQDWDWYIGLDADVILAPGWYDTLVNYLTHLEGNVFRIDFQIKDKFVDPLLWGVHVYNNTHTSLLRDVLKKTTHLNKPESAIVHQLRTHAKAINATGILLGYHGYHQYKKDIFNRFALRATRNPEWLEKYKLFKHYDEDTAIGKQGWKYGRKNIKKIDFMDYNNKKDFENEYPPLKITLEEFYKEIKERNV
jgi:hypothetical protein